MSKFRGLWIISEHLQEFQNMSKELEEKYLQVKSGRISIGWGRKENDMKKLQVLQNIICQL